MQTATCPRRIKPELEKWTPIIKGAGIKIDRRALYSPENSALLIHINELA